MAFHFMKTGADSAKLAQKAAAEQEQRKQEQGKLFRFWMKEGKEEARITFVDGDLSPEGFLVPPRYYEHNQFLNGTWNNFFVCPEKTSPDSGEKCPLCESGDKPALVALFTVIDHRTIPSKKDPKKTYKDLKRLLVAKSQTFEQLNRQAIKRGGLAGCTYDVARIGDKSPSVGSEYEFVEKKPVAELQAQYQIEKVDPKTNTKTMVTNFTPANYETEIVYRTGAELTKLLNSAGPSTPPANTGTAGSTPVDYSGEL